VIARTFRQAFVGLVASVAAACSTAGQAPASASSDGAPPEEGGLGSESGLPGDDGPAEPSLAPDPSLQQKHSASLAASPDGSLLFVVHPDGDTVTILDRSSRAILHDVLLASGPPAQDPTTSRYAPAVGPRALAVDSTGQTLYVTGQRSGALYAIDINTGTVRSTTTVCSEPIGVVVSADDKQVFVACSQDDEIAQVAAGSMAPAAFVPCPRKPWALAWGPDGKTLFATHFLGPGVSVLQTAPLALQTTWSLPDGPPQGSPEDPTEPHGQVRGIYDALVRPGTSELWTAHLMLGTDTAQPALGFDDTAFPALSLLDDHTGSQLARLSVQANPGDGEAFGDVVSGPHAMAFSSDGKLAFVVDTDSEDVLVVDAVRRVEAQLVRPLPGHMPEGIVSVGGEVYVQERSTEDIAAFRVTESDAGVSAVADGAPFPSIATDPMPATLRLGQLLFYSANSDEMPTTQDHWLACASCHLEGRSDAVTWEFAQGPRDTPTNAGGLLDTGFLFRTADRSQVQDYWRTIDVEQGGHFEITNPSQKSLLDALAAYVNYAIPAPVPPSTDASHTVQGAALDALRSQGEAVFIRVGCPNCHNGSAKTDSAAGNPSLDLTGPVVSVSAPGGVLLHDVGTCVTSGSFPDVAHQDIDGDPRSACAFDTPALRGLVDSAPYLHDGSAATLADVLPSMLAAAAGPGAQPPALTDADRQALLEFLRSL
jgi:YVTN family beta-propeller protein